MSQRHEISGTGTEPEIEPPREETAFERAVRILRAPFPPEQIGRLPRQVRKDDTNKGRCEDTPQGRRYSQDGYFCGGWHALSVHLPYVGHAALTARLLDADPAWNWEPVGVDANGLPLIVGGGMWIRLTVANVTRLGYGDAPGKRDATKELIGDALRNAAMRFGAALDLWSKEDLRVDVVEGGTEETHAPPSQTNGGGPAPSTGQGGPSPETGAQQPTIDENERSKWRTRILSCEFLGNRPKEDGPDRGLRTAYADAAKAGIMRWPIAPGAEETFLQLLQRLAAELPERPTTQEEPMALNPEGGWGHPAEGAGGYDR